MFKIMFLRSILLCGLIGASTAIGSQRAGAEDDSVLIELMFACEKAVLGEGLDAFSSIKGLEGRELENRLENIAFEAGNVSVIYIKNHSRGVNTCRISDVVDAKVPMLMQDGEALVHGWFEKRARQDNTVDVSRLDGPGVALASCRSRGRSVVLATLPVWPVSKADPEGGINLELVKESAAGFHFLARTESEKECREIVQEAERTGK